MRLAWNVSSPISPLPAPTWRPTPDQVCTFSVTQNFVPVPTQDPTSRNILRVSGATIQTLQILQTLESLMDLPQSNIELNSKKVIEHGSDFSVIQDIKHSNRI